MGKKHTAKQRVPRAAKGAAGRPQAFGDPAIRAKFLTLLRAGCSRNDAARQCGMTHRTVNQVLDREVDFRTAVDEAESSAKVLAIGCVTTAAQSNPQVALQYLGRKWPNEWAYRKPDVVTRQQFKAMIDQIVAHFLNTAPAEYHAAMLQGVNDLLMGVVMGGERIENEHEKPD